MRKILSVLTMITAAIVVFIATKKVDRSVNVDLASLSSVNKANAECADYNIHNNGKCVYYLNVCYTDPDYGGNDCIQVDD